MADPLTESAVANAVSQDADMLEAPFVFEPPSKFFAEDEHGKPIELERDPAKHYVEFTSRRTQTESYKWYIAMVGDPVLNFCSILEDGSVQYMRQPLRIPRSALYNLATLRSMCVLWSDAQAATKAVAKQTLDMNTEVSTGKRPRDDAPSVRIKPPREWIGKSTSGDIASDLAVWLWEVKDYLQLTNISPDRQAGVAASLLGGDARTQYLIKRTHAAQADPVNFQHTMQFFEDTLRELFVPVAQQANLWWKYYREKVWLLPHDSNWVITDQLMKYQEFLNKMEAQDLVPDTCTKAQLLVTHMPVVIYEALKLTNENLYQRDYKRLKDQIELEAHILQRKYDDDLAAQRALNGSAPASKRHKPDTGNTARASFDERKLSGGSGSGGGSGAGGSGSGGGSASAANTKTQASGCAICQMSNHVVNDCPFVNTNVNKRRVGFDAALQGIVRRDPVRFLSNNQPNAVFTAAGGKTGITAETPKPPSKQFVFGKKGARK